MDTSKIIRGIVNGRNYTVTSPIVKEDYGLVLQIEGVELPPTYQVDFSNSEQNGTSVTMIGNSDGVLIPHQFIDTGKDVFAFLYHVGENFGRTVYKFRIPNKVRPDRTNEEPTPEEQSVIDQAINALNEAVAQTAQDVIDADASAQSAQGYAEQAESARDTAQTYANNASASATSASQSATASANSATASAQSASQSAQIKADVEGMVDDAQGYAQASAQSASQASASEQGCARAVLDAASAAAIARARAEEASGYAQTASAKAQDASGYAQTASQKATEASQSASQALSYKTDAESAKTASQTAQGLAESAMDSAVQAKTDAESAKADAESARDKAQQAVASISGALDDKAPVITDTASGAIASFTDGADDLPLKSLVVDIDPIQDLSHGDPSPENICPISGWTGAKVTRTGKNLCDANNLASTPTPVGDRHGVTISKAGTYTIHSDAVGIGNAYIYAYSVNADGTYGALKYIVAGTVRTATTITITDGVKLIVVDAVGTNSMAISKALFESWQIQLELGSTATPYEPYTGRSITINLGQTVYGGKLYPLEGKAVVDRVFATKKWGQMSSVYSGNTHSTKGLNFDADVLKGGQNSITNITATYIEATTAQSTHYYIGSNLKTVFVVLPNDTDTDTDIQVCGTLAEPIEIQLTPQQVNSLLGVNNLWADSGDTEVEYRADTKLFIERLTAPDSADMIADSNIVSGQYFMVGNSLYKATANIANGSAIIVGTNCIRKSLSEALNEINA